MKVGKMRGIVPVAERSVRRRNELTGGLKN
jgi:hypothetical protein